MKDAVKLSTLSSLTSAVWMPVAVFGPGHFGPGSFGPGSFGPGYFGVHVMCLDYHDDLLKNRKRFNYLMDVPT